MGKRRGLLYSLIVLILTILLVVEPLGAMPQHHSNIASPHKTSSSLLTTIEHGLATVPRALGAAGSGVFHFFQGLFGSSVAKAITPQPTGSPSPNQTPPPPQEVVSLRTRDSSTFVAANGTYSAEFGHYVHYKDAAGAWQNVDLNFYAKGSDYVMDHHDLAVKVSSSGVTATEKASGKGIFFSTPVSPTTTAGGNKTSFTGQYGLTWSYFTRKSGIKLVANVSQKVGPRTYTFPYQLVGGAKALGLDAAGNLQSDVFKVPAPEVYGADTDLHWIGKWSLGSGTVSFTFDDSTLPASAYPYELDPGVSFNIAASGDDGLVQKNHIAPYPPTGSALVDTTGDKILVARKWSTPKYYIYNSLLRWDTSSIPDDATIETTTFRLYVDQKDDHDNRSLWVLWYPASNWPIDAADYMQDPGGYIAGISDLGLIQASPSGAQNDMPLINFDTNVSKTGYTALHLDIDGPIPPGSNQLRAFSFDSTSGPEPVLGVTYNRPPTAPVPDSPTGGDPTHGVTTATPVLKATGTDPDNDPLDYQFQIAKDTNFTQTICFTNGTSGWLINTNTLALPPSTQSQPCLVDGGGPYYFRAKAKDAWATTGWGTTASFYVRFSRVGARSTWPIWSHGPISVNQANGNLIFGVPGPSYPTATGSLATSASYNHVSTVDRGLGAGWTLVGGDDLANPPAKLVDHNLLTGVDKFDAVEVVFPDGSADYYSHVGATNTYTSELGDGSTLKKNADGVQYLPDTTYYTTWTLTDADGSIYSFARTVQTTKAATLAGAEITDAAAGQGAITYTYNATLDPARITSVSDTAGRSLAFTWNVLNPSGCSTALLCMTGPDGVSWKYIGDAGGGTSGRLARVNDGTRDLLAITYDGLNRPLTIQNANDLNPTGASPGYNPAHAITIAYDSSPDQGRVASVTDGPVTGQTPSNATWSFTYVAGPVTTDASTNHGAGRPADGYTLIRPPNQQGQPSPKETKTYFDNLGRTMEVIDVLGNKILVSYNSHDQLEWSEDADGNPTDYAYDPVNEVLLSVTGPDPDGGGTLGRPVTTYRYDEVSIGSSSSAGPTLQGLKGEYYANPTMVGRPDYTRTDAGVSFTSWGTGTIPKNPPTDMSSVFNDGRTDNFSVRWTGNLNVTSAQQNGQPGSYVLWTNSDDGTRLTIDGTVAVDHWIIQAATKISSNPITLGPGLHKIVLEYYENAGLAQAQLGWSCANCYPAIADGTIPASALQPGYLNQTSTVDAGGNVSFHHFADPAAGHPDYDLVQVGGLNLVTSYEYETGASMHRMLREVMPKGNATRTIDSAGNLSPGADYTYSTAWTYYGLTETATIPAACGVGTAVSQAGQQKTAQHAGIAAETAVYDATGRLVTNTNGAGSTCATYDAEGRVTSDKAPGESQATTYTYDPAGASRTATDASGTVTMEYDEAGRVKRTVDSFGAESIFLYDGDGNMTMRTSAKGSLSSNPNYVTNFSYDVKDRMTTMTDPAPRQWTFFYDSRDNLHATQYPNGTFSWADYNAAGWLTGLYNRHGTLAAPLPGAAPADANALVDYAYTYEIRGKKTQEVRSGGGLTAETQSFTYDSFGRMGSVTLPNLTLRKYEFDLDSNRTKIKETPDGGSESVVATYTYDPATTPGLDQLTRVDAGTTTDYGYTTDGQVSTKGADSITWDGRGRMSGGTFASASDSYSFDASGRLRSRTAGGQTTRYLFAGGSSVFETNAAGQLNVTSIPGPAGDLAHYAGAPDTRTTVSYLYFNGHGDLAAEANGNGNRTFAYTYDPFGAPNQTPPSNTMAERWTGRWDKQLDTSAGLIQMGARPYDPSIGRFLAVDPIEGSCVNNYDYAGQDPANGFDLSGAKPLLDNGGPSDPVCGPAWTRVVNALFNMVGRAHDLAMNYNAYGGGLGSLVWSEVLAYKQAQNRLKKALRKWPKRCGPPPSSALRFARQTSVFSRAVGGRVALFSAIAGGLGALIRFGYQVLEAAAPAFAFA